MVAERYERAAAEAERVDRSAPLAGVPILMKDFLATVAGLPLTEGSRFVAGWIPERDCEYVARLKRAGAVVLGSVTAAELAVLSSCESHRYGPTGNPRAAGKSTAGSSGGSGSAVAAGAVPVAHGSDAGGSIRMPAAACGVVGLKPTRGRNPLGPEHGDLGGGAWAEHVLTRSVRDSAAFLDATSGPAPGDPYWAPVPDCPFLESTDRQPRALRIAISPALPNGQPLHPDSAKVLEGVGRALVERGHEVIEGNPRFEVAQAEEDFFTLFSAGLAERVAMWSERIGREPAEEDLEPFTWYLVERGRACSGPEVMAVITRLQRHSREIASFYEEVDVWLSPTLGLPSFPLGYLQTGPETTVDEVLARDGAITAFTWPSNMTGQPALSYPAGVTADGDPLGVQLTGRYGEEQVLFALAAALEAETGTGGGG